MNKEKFEKVVLSTELNGEKEPTPMGAFYKIKGGEDYSEDIIDELVALNIGAIKAHEGAIGILTSYNTALSEKRELEKEKSINSATGWIDFIRRFN